MNTENETPLEQWLEETKKKNLSLKDLEKYIRNSLSCPYGTVFSQLPGLDSQDKAEILFAEWNTQPKPIEKWSVGSYVVFLKNVGSTKAGHVDVITEKGDSVSVYLKKYLNLDISRESKGEIKWFATEAEAEEFAETLVKPVKQEAELMTTEEELIAEAKKRYSIGTKFIPAHVSQNPNYFCIVCTTDFRYENDYLYAVLPDNTIYDIKNNPEYGNCDLNRIIFYKGSWATILPTKNKPQFEVGKWYQIKIAYNWIIKYKETDGNTIKAMWCCLAEPGNKVKKEGTWSSKPTEVKELSIEEIQQYLPDNHPDKIKPNQEFKVGDWVVWGDGYIDTIKRHCNSFADSWYLSERYNSCSELALRHATQDEINKHLISIGELMADELLTPKYTIYGDVTYVGETGIVEGPLKMILSIDDEELPMVDIIKTKSTQILNNY